MSWNLAKSQIKVTVKVVFFLFYFIFLVVKYQTLYLPALCNDFAQSSPNPLFLASPASAVHSSSLKAGFSLKINLRLKLGLGDSGKAFLFFFFPVPNTTRCQFLGDNHSTTSVVHKMATVLELVNTENQDSISESSRIRVSNNSHAGKNADNPKCNLAHLSVLRSR